MDFLHQVKQAFMFYWKAIRFIDEHNIWRTLILPAILNLILALLLVLLTLKTSGYVMDAVISAVYPTNSVHLSPFLEGLLLLLIRGSVIFLYLKIYRYLILILFAPIYAFVSGKIQTILQVKRKTQVSSGQYLADCSRGMRIAFKHFFIDVLITFALVLIALLITWILPFLPFLILIVESYFFGYSMLDYRNEFIGLSPQESKQLINNYPGLVIGNGLFFNFFLLIPFIGVLFAPMLALIAAGKSINFMEKRKSLLCASDQSTLIMAKS